MALLPDDEPAADVGVTDFEIGVDGLSSIFLVDGVDALLDVPDLNYKQKQFCKALQILSIYCMFIFSTLRFGVLHRI